MSATVNGSGGAVINGESGGGDVTPEAVAAALDALYSELPVGDFLVSSGGSEAAAASEQPAAVRAVIGASGVSSGTDAALPTATTGNIGTIYTATDTGQVYLCESNGSGGARWRNMLTGHLDGAALRVAAAAVTQTGTTSRAAPTTATIVIYTRVATLPSGISQHGTGNFSGGFQLEIGNNSGDRGLFTLYRTGSSPVRTELTGASFTGALGVVRGLALHMTASALRWSWNGGAVGSAALTGTPSGTGLPWVGAPSSFHAHDIVAVRWLAEAASDADLQTLSGSAAVATGRIPVVASATTVLLDWSASRMTSGTTASRFAGSYAEAASGSTAGVVTT